MRGVIVRKSSGAFHLTNDRIKRAVGVLRRTEVAQAHMRLGGEPLEQRGHSRDLPIPASPERSTT